MIYVVEDFNWVHYLSSQVVDDLVDIPNCGKWMYHYSDIGRVMDLCRNAVESGVVLSAKHTNDHSGVSCFYVDGLDREAHLRVLEYFVSNDMIRRKKNGDLYNISFKFDEQTQAGEYGSNFVPVLKLYEFLDPSTGSPLS